MLRREQSSSFNTYIQMTLVHTREKAESSVQTCAMLDIEQFLGVLFVKVVVESDQRFFFTYQLSKHLRTILQPLTDKSRRKLQSTENFIDAIKTVQIPEDYKLVTFDGKSLFTSIPLQFTVYRDRYPTIYR